MPVPSDINRDASAPPHTAASPAVLIIDDDDSIRVLSQWIVQRAGYRVLTARDGPEGLACFRSLRGEIGLVLLDLTMPRMSGAEVVSQLHQLGANVPVVLITGYGEEAVREEEKIGVVGVLQKPFTPEGLRTVLNQWLPVSAGAAKSG